MTKPTQDIEFWRERIRSSSSMLEAIGISFDWGLIDSIHRPIVESFVSPNDKVLDVACGIGRTADWFSDEQYTGIDFVPEFIEDARKEHPGKRFELCNFVTDDLQFQEKFDWAILISVKMVIAPVIGRDIWDQVEWKLRKYVKKGILIFEYGNSLKEEAEKFELLRPYEALL